MHTVWIQQDQTLCKMFGYSRTRLYAHCFWLDSTNIVCTVGPNTNDATEGDNTNNILSCNLPQMAYVPLKGFLVVSLLRVIQICNRLAEVEEHSVQTLGVSLREDTLSV